MDLIILILLGAVSIVGLTFIVERGFALRWKKAIPPHVRMTVETCKGRSDLPRVHQVCGEHPSPLSRLLLLAEAHLDWPRQENISGLETRARHEVSQLERGLVVLEIIVGIAPLLGLVGTIYGLIMLFTTLGTVGMGDNSALAKGIALALNATLMGLLTAIPSLIAWSYYNKKVERIAVEMETLCDEFLRSQYAGGGESRK